MWKSGVGQQGVRIAKEGAWYVCIHIHTPVLVREPQLQKLDSGRFLWVVFSLRVVRELRFKDQAPKYRMCPVEVRPPQHPWRHSSSAYGTQILGQRLESLALRFLGIALLSFMCLNLRALACGTTRLRKGSDDNDRLPSRKKQPQRGQGQRKLSVACPRQDRERWPPLPGGGVAQ